MKRPQLFLNLFENYGLIMKDTGFKEQIFAAVAKIPKGKVATYAHVAEMAGYSPKAARAVGNAIHSNTDPKKVPCHRVVTAHGELGRNYGLGGPEQQYKRLREEGITFVPDTKAPAGVRVEKKHLLQQTGI